MINAGLTAEQVAAVLGFSLGYLWGEAFSRADQAVKYESEWFKHLSQFRQWLISGLLDALHHFQYGLALILAVLVMGETLPAVFQLLLAYAGWGLVASDWRDFRNVLKRLGLLEAELRKPHGEVRG
ncbi:MAG: hypothetical protein N3F10_06595 [Candidatus Bathyarchaeota archaeon]|nr:hypothetical protein [Candidatus Bathyarchaeota archaeon]